MSYSQIQRDNSANANATTLTSNLPERVENTLAELLTLFLPPTDGPSVDGKSREELEQEADERFDAAFERAIGTLEGSGVGSRSKGRDEEDVNGSGDLIKKKRQFDLLLLCSLKRYHNVLRMLLQLSARIILPKRPFASRLCTPAF